MMKKLLITLTLLAIIPLVLGASVTITSLTINTEPNHDLMIKITNADNGNKVQEMIKNSGESGVLQTNIYSLGVKDVEIDVSVSKDFVDITRETFGPYAVINPITVDLDLSKTKQEETEEINTEENISEGITGQVIEETEEKSKIPANAIWYVLGVAVIGVAIFFVVKFSKNKFNVPQSFTVKKQSQLLKEQKEALEEQKSDGQENKIVELESKLKTFQEEFAKIKNKEKIEDAEKRVKEEMERLERLKRGEE